MTTKKRDKQVATYLNEELYEFFVTNIIPRYGQGLSASDTIKLLLIQEQRRITNNNTKEHDLEIIKGDTTILKAKVAKLEQRIERLEAQNELMLMALMGVLVQQAGEPIRINPLVAENIRQLVDEVIMLSKTRRLAEPEVAVEAGI